MNEKDKKVVWSERKRRTPSHTTPLYISATLIFTFCSTIKLQFTVVNGAFVLQSVGTWTIRCCTCTWGSKQERQFFKGKIISMKLRILISICFFSLILTWDFEIKKKLSWLKILGKWTLNMGILVKTVRIHVSRILLQTREIWYEKCDSSILRKKRENKQSNWALH